MPVYEFVCQRCRHPFEELVLGSERPSCPSCGSAELEKQLSSFAVNGEPQLLEWWAPEGPDLGKDRACAEHCNAGFEDGEHSKCAEQCKLATAGCVKGRRFGL